MKQNRKFALSTIALLIQAALCFEANAAEYEVENVEYVSLQPDPQRLGSVSTWKGGKITVKQTILPYWQKGETRRKLEVITTGNGADGNLLVNGVYGIQSFADPQLGYTPELLVKSNNDIIFNNDFQSVDVQPHSGNIHLDAKGKIQFNLNVADKATDPTTHQEKLVNDKALVRYYNTITPPPDENDKGSISFHSKTGNLFNMNVNVHKDTHHFGIQNLNNTDVNLTAEDGDNVVAIKGKLADPMPAGKVESTSFLRGIETAFKSNTVLRGNNNKISITTEGGGLGLGVNGLQSNSPYSGHTTGIFINNQSSDLTKPSLDGVSTIELKAVKGNNEVDLNVKHHASVKGIIASHSATATLEAEGDNIVRVKNPDTNTALINAWKEKYPNNSPELYRVGVQSTTDSDVVLNAANNIIEIGGNPMNQAGITAHGNATITLKAKENNKITVENAAYSSDGISTLINRTGARPGKRDDGNKIILEAGGDNIVTMKSGDADADYVNNSDILKGTDSYKYKRGSNGIFAYDDKSLVKLVGENNIVKSEISEKSRALNGGFDHNSIYSWNKAKVELSAKNDNIVQGGTSGLRSSDSSIVLEGKNNAISSLKHNVFAYNKAKVDLTAENKNTLSDAEFGVYALHATSTVNLSSKDKNEVKSTKIGLYSQDGGSINVDGKDNIIEGDKFALIGMNGNLSIHANHENQINSKESGIYAGNTAKIALTGESNTIHASNAAIHSLDKSEVSIDGQITIHSSVANIARRDNSLINLRYKGNSSIDGATVSDGGSVSITPLDNSDDNVMRLTGDVLAVNKGKVELDFTPNSRLVGRLDNFSGLNNPKHKDLFEQYVNLDSKSAGEINLNLAKDALWTMTGQSWMDKLSGEGTVDFDSNSKTSGRALHIGELAGANKFLMHLNKDGIHSDMLYVKKGTSTPQEVVVKNLSEVLDSMNYGDRLRFATVRENSGNEFVNGKKYIDDTHLMEQALTVEYSDHKTDPSNNEDYNRRFNGETMTAEKAGNTDVDAMYGSEHRKNVYLVKQATGNPSRNVKNISDMFDSTAHYAFTLDTYTKREGERAFSTLDKKEGDWIRLTHSRLIQSNAFRFHNNDFEIGYDRFSLNEQEKKRKWGISFDYGHGRTSLWNTFGKGKIRKYELALYNTTQYIDKEGDETGYIDNVLKIGKLRNRVIARNHMGQLWGEGKYSNTLFSISTEYGRRKFLDDDKLWRITPQVQLQYSYLRGAGYRLDNGINVNLSHVNSLIGRLGLDVVRKFDEGKKLFYIKGNILHEFLGSRSFKAFEGNSNYAQKWNTRGTWYSVGLGYNARTGKKTYVFADAEKEFSGGKKGSYNIRLSVSHQFD